MAPVPVTASTQDEGAPPQRDKILPKIVATRHKIGLEPIMQLKTQTGVVPWVRFSY